MQNITPDSCTSIIKKCESITSATAGKKWTERKDCEDENNGQQYLDSHVPAFLPLSHCVPPVYSSTEWKAGRNRKVRIALHENKAVRIEAYTFFTV